VDRYSRTNKMQFLYSVYYELTASTCFEHYLLIFTRCCTNNNWYIACVLCWLAATRVGVEPVLLRAPQRSMEHYVQLFIAFVGPQSERRRLLGPHDILFGTQILTTHTYMLVLDVSSHMVAIWACMQITWVIMAQ
jgi:hypothetical protein